jgi:hypothetical protein
VADCFRKYRIAAQQDGELAGVMINVLNTLDANKATSVTIQRAGLGDNKTKPEDLSKVTSEGTNATIYLDPVNPDQHLPLIGDNVHDVCGLLIHELEHALRMMEGTVSLRVCQLPGGRLDEAEISAQALGNVYRKLSKKPPLESYDGIRLPASAINPTRVDFDNISVPGWWCP